MSTITSTNKKDVAIIGLGVSGLAATKAFLQKGHNVIAFESSLSLGGVWNPDRSYPGVKTQSSKDLYRFTDFPMPDSYPEWPSGEQVLAYLNDYADKFNLRKMFRFGMKVVKMEPRKHQKPGWILSFANVNKNNDSCDDIQQIEFDFVVVCTGTCSNPKMISHPGQDAFIDAGGIVKHSSEYKDTLKDDSLKGKKVVIIGGAKSATDIAVHCTKQDTANVTLLMRRQVWRIPYFVAGKINIKNLLYMRAQEVQFPSWKLKSSKLLNAMYWLLYPIFWVNFRMLEMILRFQLQFQKYGMSPEGRIEGSNGASCSTPIVTEGFFEAIKEGSIHPIHTNVAKYDTKVLVLENGLKIEADVVIQATGWTIDFPYFPKKLNQDLFEESDGLFRLYRFAINPKHPNIGFVGFNSSFCTVLSSEMISNWLVRYVDGMLAKQPSTNEMEITIDRTLDWKRNMYPAAKSFKGGCIAPFHHLHFDEILDDMGAKKKNNSWFIYPKAELYGACLQSAPAYTVTPS